ncbi:MAG: group II truncated hemoglobin [Immundisolibacteraceae bacterium]|nr:group II truncated hemoglobin [Immundisolibacteraceae bacterium]
MTTDALEEQQTEATTGDSLYAWLGGEQGIKNLVNRFYDIMDSDESAKPIRDMHKEDLSPMRLSLFEFLSGWLGGPALFIERHGSACLTGTHRPFKIDVAAREQWMNCMKQAMVDIDIKPKYRDMLTPAFERMAEMLRNSD